MDKKLTNSQLLTRIRGLSKKLKPEARKSLEIEIKYATRGELESILKKLKSNKF